MNICKKIYHGPIEIVAAVEPLRKGVYAMVVTAHHTRIGSRLGSRQQAQAIGLKLEAKGALTAELYAAGWHTEQTPQGVAWYPPRV